jgi:alpha-glucosidase
MSTRQLRDARWWEGGCLYQVYVRSFQDSDGDGFGDLPGVIDRLDHLAWLGVDGIWLSPTMPSPDADWGYDVAGYQAVHPELGTMSDLDRLIAEAADRGIRVLLDLVPNHTSDAHAWFVESRSGRESAKRDWYVWADPAPGGAPPNNWADATGATAWTFDEASGQYYLHNFLPGQPDLNWWNPAVGEAFERIITFWLDRGIAGFRIDVAHGLYKDRDLRDNPVAQADDGSVRPVPVYSMNRPEVHDTYREWRKLAEAYTPPGLLLGETWVLDTQRLASFYGEDDELQLGFNFVFIKAPFTAPALSMVVADTLAALPAGACPVWCGSNHDISRFPTRWAAGDPQRARLALALLCTLPGTVVLYYGDELGLPDVDVPAALQRDDMSRRARFNRDRARTPMPWNDAPGAGFTTAGVTPWLPIGDRREQAVAQQLADEASTLWLTRRLLALRREAIGPGVAGYEQLPSGKQQWVYRCGGLIVAANLSGEGSAVDLPEAAVALSTASNGPGSRDPGGRATLAPWEALVLRAG